MGIKRHKPEALGIQYTSVMSSGAFEMYAKRALRIRFQTAAPSALQSSVI